MPARAKYNERSPNTAMMLLVKTRNGSSVMAKTAGIESIAKIKVAKNCKVSLFADEKQFPELANPVQMGWDTKGRLWVAAWKNYPEREPTSISSRR